MMRKATMRIILEQVPERHTWHPKQVEIQNKLDSQLGKKKENRTSQTRRVLGQSVTITSRCQTIKNWQW
jgi:hypothetical protein